MREDITKNETTSSITSITINEISQKPFITVQELSKIMGIGLTYTYEFIKSEECPFNTLKLGKRYIIPTNSFLSWYDNLK